MVTFVTIARERSFARASEILHLSQPSVSARIQKLENEVGQPLFSRGRQIKLTKEGEALFPYALQLLDVHSEALEKINNLNNVLEGKVTIGATAFWTVYILPSILGEILRNYPKIEFKLLTGKSEYISQLLEKNQIDIGLVSSKVSQNELSQDYLSEVEMSIVCGPNHSFIGKTITMEELIREPVITYQQTSDGWKKILSIYSDYDAKPNIVMELNQIEAVKQMVNHSMCISFLPTLSIQKELESGLLKKVQVKDFPLISHDLTMIQLKNKSNSRLLSLLIDILKRKLENKKN